MSLVSSGAIIVLDLGMPIGVVAYVEILQLLGIAWYNIIHRDVSVDQANVLPKNCQAYV